MELVLTRNMNAARQGINQKICDDMTELQTDIEQALRRIFEQAGSKINPEEQEVVQKQMEGTKQILERFKVNMHCNVTC